MVKNTLIVCLIIRYYQFVVGFGSKSSQYNPIMSLVVTLVTCFLSGTNTPTAPTKKGGRSRKNSNASTASSTSNPPAPSSAADSARPTDGGADEADPQNVSADFLWVVSRLGLVCRLHTALEIQSNLL